MQQEDDFDIILNDEDPEKIKQLNIQLQQDKAQMLEKIAKLEKEKNELSALIQVLQSNSSQQSKNNQQVEYLNKQINDLQNEVMLQKASNSNFQQLNAQYTSNIASLQKNCELMKKELDKVKSDFVKSQQVHEQELKKVVSGGSETNLKIQKFQQQIKLLEENLSSKEIKLQQYEKEITQLQKRLQDQQKEFSSKKQVQINENQLFQETQMLLSTISNKCNKINQDIESRVLAISYLQQENGADSKQIITIVQEDLEGIKKELTQIINISNQLI